MSELRLKDEYYQYSILSLDRVLKPSPRAYICPVCIEPFSDIDQLSHEHVPPKSVGGRKICLTCKACNSKAGHTIDYAISKENSFSNLGAIGSPTHRIKFEFKGHSLNANLERDLEGVKVNVLPGLNNPSVMKSMLNELKSCNWEDTTFEIKASGGYMRHTADVAYLKSAYLAAFAKFGYRWIFSPATEVIREQIQHPDKKLLEGARTYLKDSSTTEFAFYVAKEPFPYLFALMGDSGVFLPWIEHESKDLYSWVKKERKKAKSIKCNFIEKWSWPKRMELVLDQL